MKHFVTAIIALLVALPAPARAGGIFVPGVGPTAQARAGAFVARADDPTAMAHNPAGFGKLDGTVVYIGANFVKLDLTFQRYGSYEATGASEPYEGEAYPELSNNSKPSPGLGPFQALPIIVVSTDFGMPHLPIRAAFGLITPHGSAGRDFADTVTLPNGVEAPAPQRYDVGYQKATAADPSIAVAYSPIEDLHIGVRLSWGFSFIQTTKVVWAIDNYDEYREKDSVIKIDSKDLFVPSAGLGVLYQPTPNVEIGAAYSSAKHIRAKGTLTSQAGSEVPAANAGILPDLDFWKCAPNGVEGKLKNCLDINLPQTASIGARYILRNSRGGERADIELDIKWEDWSNATTTVSQTDGLSAAKPLETTLIRHGFQDVISTRLGGSYTLDVGNNELTIRAGAAYDTKTAPLSWTRADTDGKPRTTLTTGIGFRTGRWRIDIGGGVVLEPTREVRHACPVGGPTRESPNCDGVSGGPTPVDERTAPDPSQPLQAPKNQLESPFNAGRYESGYLLMHLGLSASF